MKRIKILAFTLFMTAATLPSFAQKWGNTPEDSVNCVTNTFLYRDAYNNKQYLEAYEFWKECLKSCPANNKNLYIRGGVILKTKFNSTKDMNERKAILDELMQMHDLRIQYFGEAADVTSKKAYDYEQMMGLSAVKDYYPIYAEAMRLGAAEVEPVFIGRYFEATVRYVVAGHADTTLIIDNYDIAIDALETIISKTQDSAKKAEIYNVAVNIESLFSPFASCEELVNIYTKKFKANPDDVNLLKKITSILRKKNCMNTDLFFQATEKLYSIEPSASTAYLMGQMCYNNDKFNEAAKYINDALKDVETPKDRYNMYILLGLCYANTSNYTGARSAYQKAAEIDGTKGEPYRLLAQLYAKGARATSDGLGGRTAYWAAVDMARRAISVDSSPENVEAANKLISSYSANFPKQSDAFMLDLIDGHSYTVPGWIGVTTTVRTRK